MSIHEEIANKVVAILKGDDALYTDGNILSTDKNDFPAQSCTKASARDILLLSSDIDVHVCEDGTLECADVWVDIDDEEVCIDVSNNTVQVGFYNSAQVSYRTSDDVIGLYDELINGDYI